MRATASGESSLPGKKVTTSRMLSPATVPCWAKQVGIKARSSSAQLPDLLSPLRKCAGFDHFDPCTACPVRARRDNSGKSYTASEASPHRARTRAIAHSFRQRPVRATECFGYPRTGGCTTVYIKSPLIFPPKWRSFRCRCRITAGSVE